MLNNFIRSRPIKSVNSSTKKEKHKMLQRNNASNVLKDYPITNNANNY